MINSEDKYNPYAKFCGRLRLQQVNNTGMISTGSSPEDVLSKLNSTEHRKVTGYERWVTI